MIRYPNSLETKKARRKCVPEDNKVRGETASLLEIHHGIVTLMLWFRVRLAAMLDTRSADFGVLRHDLSHTHVRAVALAAPEVWRSNFGYV